MTYFWHTLCYCSAFIIMHALFSWSFKFLVVNPHTRLKSAGLRSFIPHHVRSEHLLRTVTASTRHLQYHQFCHCIFILASASEYGVGRTHSICCVWNRVSVKSLFAQRGIIRAKQTLLEFSSLAVTYALLSDVTAESKEWSICQGREGVCQPSGGIDTPGEEKKKRKKYTEQTNKQTKKDWSQTLCTCNAVAFFTVMIFLIRQFVCLLVQIMRRTQWCDIVKIMWLKADRKSA